MFHVVAYVHKHYPQLVVNADFILQELLRTKSAIEFNDPKNQDQPGRSGLEDVKTYAPCFALSNEFKAFVDETLQSVDWTAKNLRGPLKQLWMWPNHKQYLPWNVYESKDVSMATIAKSMNEVLPNTKLELVHGKLYLNMTGFQEVMWKQIETSVRQFLGLPGLRQNVETEHVTLVNSDVISKLDAKQVEEFVQYAQTRWSMSAEWSPKEFRHTISLDWARFSVCVVLHIESKMLMKLMSEFDEMFGTTIAKKLESGLHTTLGILPRM